MKRDMLPPLAVLAVILAFALWNSAAITGRTQRWRDQLQQVEELAAADVVNYSLSNFDAVCEVAADEGKIRPEDIARLKKFRADPSDESWIG